MTEPADSIRAAIADHGPINFAEYMDLALYGPGGYYEQPPIGPHGDFVTSPHVHPVFGKLLAGAVREMWEGLDRPDPLLVVEVGAGDGTLARTALSELGGLPVSYTAVERSKGARELLDEVRGVTAAESIPERVHVALANELLDNLPFRRIRGSAEVRVEIDGDGLAEVEVPWPGDAGPEGEETIVPEAAVDFIEELAVAMTPGYALLVDYTGSGPVHGYSDHRVLGEVLESPGQIDVTAGVPHGTVISAAESAGLAHLGTVSQRAALLALGFENWVRGELERQTELLNSEEPLEAVRSWSGRSRATILVDPSALGRLSWIVLASPGLPEPDWLRAAAEIG